MSTSHYVIRTWASCDKCYEYDRPEIWGPETVDPDTHDRQLNHLYHSDPAWMHADSTSTCVTDIRSAQKFDSYAEAQERLWQIDGWWEEYETGEEHTGPYYWIEEMTHGD